MSENAKHSRLCDNRQTIELAGGVSVLKMLAQHQREPYLAISDRIGMILYRRPSRAARFKATSRTVGHDLPKRLVLDFVDEIVETLSDFRIARQLAHDARLCTIRHENPGSRLLHRTSPLIERLHMQLSSWESWAGPRVIALTRINYREDVLMR
nr:hypothetical protein [Nitratireductor luteus]